MKWFIKRIIISTLLILGVFILVLRFGGYFFLDDKINKETVKTIKSSPTLPDRFYELYELAYPNSLNTGITMAFIHSAKSKILNQRLTRRATPSVLVADMAPYNYYLKMKPPFVYYIEDHTTQKQCLNCFASRLNFLNNNIGVESASKYYFKEELKNLDDRQMVQLIVMMKNTSLYNPARRPERLENKVNEIMEKLMITN